MKTGWYKFIIVLLLVLNISLLYQNWNLKRGGDTNLIEPSEYTASLQVSDLVVVDTAGQPLSLKQLAARHPVTFLVFYSPSDCPTCFEEKTFWVEIAERTGIPVIGIASNASSAELWVWNLNNEIPIVTYVDTTFAVFDFMRFEMLPLKLLVDASGTVLWADPVRLEPKEQKAFWEDLTYVIQQNQR